MIWSRTSLEVISLWLISWMSLVRETTLGPRTFVEECGTRNTLGEEDGGGIVRGGGGDMWIYNSSFRLKSMDLLDLDEGSLSDIFGLEISVEIYTPY